MKIKTFIVDSFTNTPFKGNPAGVCLLEEPIDIEIMQSIATELNLSETAFLLKTESNHFYVKTLGGNLEVYFDHKGEDKFENIWLKGPATFVFNGKLDM